MSWLEALRRVWLEYLDPPQWGVRDCCQLASRYVFLRTGVDHAATFHYTDKAGALQLLADHGGMVGLISECIGAPVEREPHEGDLVACDLGIGTHSDEVLTTGIFNGQYVIGFHPDDGLCRIPKRLIRQVWNVE